MEREKLLRALEAVKLGLSNKGFIEQMGCFIFTGDRVVTYNDEITITHPLQTGITGAVRAEQLYKLLGKLPDSRIRLKATETELLVSDGRIKAGIPLQTEIELPLLDYSKIKGWVRIPDGFLEAVGFCLFSCARDITTPQLSCIYVNKKGGTVESTDNFRLTRVNVKGLNAFPTSFLLPVHAAEGVFTNGGEVEEVAVEENWVHFRLGDQCMFSARTYTEVQYPNLSEVVHQFEQKKEKVKITLPKALPDILQRAMIFAGDSGTERVTVSVLSGKMEVRAEGVNGWFKEVDEVDYEGETVVFRINPHYLADICEKTNYLEVTDGMAGFRSEEWIHIVALMSEKEEV